MITEFQSAVQSGDLDAVNRFLDVDPALAAGQTEDGLPLVMAAIYYGHPDLARHLIDSGAKEDIFTAAALNDGSVLEDILAKQPSAVQAFSVDGFQPLGLAAFFGAPKTVECLLRHKADTRTPSNNPMQVMPLHSAVAGQHVQIARMLLEAGAPVNAAQQDGFTPLHAAAQNGQLDMVRLLLEHGADVNVVAGKHGTPADLAKAGGFTEILDLLEQYV
jgi:ankyrin repeat protein